MNSNDIVSEIRKLENRYKDKVRELEQTINKLEEEVQMLKFEKGMKFLASIKKIETVVSSHQADYSDYFHIIDQIEEEIENVLS